MQQMIDHYGFATNVMAASIQNIQHVKTVAQLGVAAATLAPTRFTEWLTTHTLTGEATKAFDECWAPFAKQYAGSLAERVRLFLSATHTPEQLRYTADVVLKARTEENLMNS